jgi:hypothetical protein
VAKVFEMRSFRKDKNALASPKNEPNFPNFRRIGRNYFLPIDMLNGLPGRPSPPSKSGISINAGARWLLVAGVLCGLYLSGDSEKSTVANPNRDQQLQTRVAPVPSEPARPVSSPLPIFAADKGPAPVRHLQTSPVPRYSPVKYEATRKKVFGACTGQLELTGSKLYFHCPNQAELIFPVAAIAKAHKDGVVLKSGDKYHFMIANHTREQVEAIFTSWLDRVQQSP